MTDFAPDARQPAVPVTAAPPAIPAAHTGPTLHSGRHALVWVYAGTARVHTENGAVHRLGAGDAVWIPAHLGRRVETDPRSVALPYPVAADPVPHAPHEPVRVSVPDGWTDWLVMHFAHQVAPITSIGYTQTTLLDVLGRAPSPVGQGSGSSTYPRPPAAAGAHTVAEELLRDPSIDHTLEQWAALVGCRAHTLRRAFQRETAMTFAQWRTECRLTAACEFLGAGYDVSQTAAHTGFASRNGFTRTFGKRFGLSPRAYANRHRAAAQPMRVAAARQSGLLAHLVAGPDGPRERPVTRRALPGTRTARHTNDRHVLTWSYRGSGYLRIGEATYERRAGETLWIPAGVEHEAGTRADSIGLPVGTVAADEFDLTRPVGASFPPSWQTYLLHCAVSDRTAIRPDGYDRRHIVELFHEQAAADRARSVPLPRDARARAVALDFLRRMGGSTEYTVDSAVGEAFVTETGMTFASWRQAARMRLARQLLARGATCTHVAHRLGYTRLPNFSRAFSRFHGLSPREYQEHEAAPGVRAR